MTLFNYANPNAPYINAEILRHSRAVRANRAFMAAESNEELREVYNMYAESAEQKLVEWANAIIEDNQVTDQWLRETAPEGWVVADTSVED